MRALMLMMIAVPVMADDKADWKSLAGDWVVEKVEIEGTDQTAIFKDAVLSIEEGKYSFAFNKIIDKGTLKIDSSKTPKSMDIVGTDGPNKGKTFLCIYKIEEKSIVVCYSLDDKPRPTEFKSTKDSKTMVITYKKKG